MRHLCGELPRRKLDGGGEAGEGEGERGEGTWCATSLGPLESCHGLTARTNCTHELTEAGEWCATCLGPLVSLSVWVNGQLVRIVMYMIYIILYMYLYIYLYIYIGIIAFLYTYICMYI